MSQILQKKEYVRAILLYYFEAGKSPQEARKLMTEVYGSKAPKRTFFTKWFARFSQNDFDLKDRKRSGQPKKFENNELDALLEEDPTQTQAQLASSLGVTQQTVSLRLARRK